MEECLSKTSHAYRSHRRTIDVLPDDTLLEIFNLHRLEVSNPDPSKCSWEWPWRRLTHVSQRWRHLVFSFPCRLHVGLLCKRRTPVKEFLGIWPALPIIMHYGGPNPVYDEEENLVGALRHSDRIKKIELNSFDDGLALEMRKPMPLLESLELTGRYVVLPDDFLGGSAPALRQVILDEIAFPALPKFLLSTINLVTLELWRYPENLSPAALVMGLSASKRLKILIMHFRMVLLDESTFPMERAVLPALTNLTYHGYVEYFDNFVARIDTPLIKLIHLRFHNNEVIEFPYLHDFIRRTRQLGSPTRAEIESCKIMSDASIALMHHPAMTCSTSPGHLRLNVSMARPRAEDHVSVISQLSCKLSPFLPGVRQLDIDWPNESQGRIYDDPVKWAEILRQFNWTERLYVKSGQALNIAQVLRQAASELDPGFLPALRELRLGCFGHIDVIKPFVEARQRSGNPVNADSDEEEEDEDE